MSLLSPAGLLAGVLLGPLVLWYLLRSRRPVRLVSSTLLFTSEQQTASAAVPWQPFRADRTFWLVALATLLGALALARPAVAVPAAVADHTILVVDASASMRAATEDGHSRLEQARTVARDLIDRAGQDRVVSVIEAGARARVLADAQYARDASRALDRLTAGATRPALDQALTLAGALVRPGEETVVHVLTDGGLPPDALAVAPAGTLLDIVGASQPNLAIGALQVTPLGGDDARVLVDLASFADLPVSARVAVLSEGQEIAVRRADVPPRGRIDVQVEAGDVTTDVLEVVVTAEGSDPAGTPLVDAQPHDDRAWVVLPQRSGLQVLVVGPPNVFLDAALQALPDVTTQRRAGVPRRLDEFDVLVVDREDMPAALAIPTLAIAPTQLPEGATTTGRRETPTVTSIDADHPLLADADLDRLAVAEMAAIDAPTMQPVIDGPDGPLLLSGRLGGAAAVLLPFALADSNLPLQVAFPVLVANAVQSLAGPTADTPLVAGPDRTLPVAAEGTATLIDPDGAAVLVEGPGPTATLDRTGIWTLTRTGQPAVRLAVNPDIAESDLAVHALSTLPANEEDDGQIAVGDRVLPAGTLPDVPAAEGRVELSRWFLLAAAAVLAAELLASTLPRRRPRAVAS